MRISIKWLKEYIDYKGSAKELADLLTMSGTETELFSEANDIDKNIVVGEIIKIEPHPNADKLRLPTVKISATKTIKLVCGASNIEVGQKVPVALVGAKLGDFEINEAEIRGVRSVGMICSAQELGLEEHSEGIMVLDPSSKIGEKLETVLSKETNILEAELTPNRGDCLSVLGIAREVSAVTGCKIMYPNKAQKSKEGAPSNINIKIIEKNLCTNYLARALKIVKNGDSPAWMQERLSDYGIRPISAVVDITNYVMLEFGQPLHAFDLTRINANINTNKSEIVVRKAKEGEEIITLDAVKRKLTKEDLVIADAKGAIAIAGVMGGENTQVDENTTDIFLESATFNKTSVRRTAQRLNLRSESSNRFEKGIPILLNEIALNRAVELFVEICDAKVISQCDGVVLKDIKPIRILVNYKKINDFLGKEIEQSKINSILKGLGFEINKAKKSEDIFVTAPWWRLDIEIKEDIYEEVGRIYGYNNIAGTLPAGIIPIDNTVPIIKFSSSLKKEMRSNGFTELCNYSFTSIDWFNFLGLNVEKTIKIANPISEELKYMRISLVPSLLSVVAKNHDIFSEIKIFEIAKTYKKENHKNLPTENTHLSGAVFGGETKSNQYGEGREFYIAKGALKELVRGFEKVELKQSKVKYLSAGKSADIYINNENIGFVGEISQNILRKFGIKKKTAIFDIDLNKLLKSKQKAIKYKPFSRFPSVSRDLAFVVNKEITVLEILREVSKTESPIIQEMKIGDIYEGKELGADKKSVAIKFVYQSNEKTLEDGEVAEIEDKIIKNVAQKLGGVIRGK